MESNFCGRLPHVSSQLAMIPSSRSMLSRDKRLPLDTCNQFGLQENDFGNQFSTFDSSRDYSQRKQSDSKDSKYRNCNSTNSLIHSRSWCGKFDSKTQFTSCYDFSSDAMLWIKEVEMVVSVDDLKSSSSTRGISMPNFCDQFVERIFQTSRCWTRRLLLH